MKLDHTDDAAVWSPDQRRKLPDARKVGRKGITYLVFSPRLPGKKIFKRHCPEATTNLLPAADYSINIPVNLLMEKIGLGGSCHWCTEAIFLSLKGVEKVDQGWIASDGDAAAFSEAVLVTFDPLVISLATLIAVHLHTHSCTSAHSMRTKYRSAIYTFTEAQMPLSLEAIRQLQPQFEAPVITQVLPFVDFKLNHEEYLNYYYKDPEKPFCKNVVGPKLKLLMEQFGQHYTKRV